MCIQLHILILLDLKRGLKIFKKKLGDDSMPLVPLVMSTLDSKPGWIPSLAYKARKPGYNGFLQFTSGQHGSRTCFTHSLFEAVVKLGTMP